MRLNKSRKLELRAKELRLGFAKLALQAQRLPKLWACWLDLAAPVWSNGWSRHFIWHDAKTWFLPKSELEQSKKEKTQKATSDGKGASLLSPPGCSSVIQGLIHGNLDELFHCSDPLNEPCQKAMAKCTKELSLKLRRQPPHCLPVPPVPPADQESNLDNSFLF